MEQKKRIISNKVYDSLQVPTFKRVESKSTILYANTYSGIGEVPFPRELAEILNSNSGLTGNNLLLQLKKKVEFFPDGPWYVDSRDGVIYIHNRDFQADPVHSYVYQHENGELLTLSIQTNYVTRSAAQSLFQDIDPLNKNLVSDNNSIDQSKLAFDKIKGGAVRDATFVSTIGQPFMFANQLSGQYGAEDRLPYKVGKTPPALPMVREAQKKKINQAQKEYNSKSPKTLSEDSIIANMPHETIVSTMKQVLYEQYTPEEMQKVIARLSSARQSGEDLSAVAKDLFKGHQHVFDGDYAPDEWGYTWVDPRDYAPSGKRTFDQIYAINDLNRAESEYKAGLDAIKKSTEMNIVPGTQYFGTYSSTNPAAGDPARKNEYIESRVKVFKRVKKNLKVPVYKICTNLLDRYGALNSGRANANANQRTKEKEISATMTVVGRPNLRSSMVLNIQNVGKHSGPWYIKTCSHRIEPGSGYTCQLTLIKNSVKSGSKSSSLSVNTQDIVTNNASIDGKSKIGKNKPNSAGPSGYNLTTEESVFYEKLKTSEERRLFAAKAQAYREQNANTPSKGSEGIVEVETTSSSTGNVVQRWKVKDVKLSKEQLDQTKKRTTETLRLDKEINDLRIDKSKFPSFQLKVGSEEWVKSRNRERWLNSKRIP